MSASLRFVQQGPSRYHVFDGDTQIGWMDDRTIGLLGFDDPAGARRAGAAGYATVVRWHGTIARDERSPTLQLSRPDAVAADDRIESDGAVVGRVVRAPGAGGSGARFGFELARTPGQPFAASIHLFHRLLSVAAPSSRLPGPDHRASGRPKSNRTRAWSSGRPNT